MDYTSAVGIKGSLAEVSVWLAKVLDPFTIVQYLVANFAIEIDGDRARSVCYFHNPMGLSGTDDTMSIFWCGGPYIDEFVRTPEGWRICHRIDEVQYMHGLPTPSPSSHRD